MTEQNTAAQALAAVMADVHAVGKDNKSGAGYQYRSIDGLINGIAPAMHKHGLILVPNVESCLIEEMPGRKGWVTAHLTVSYWIYGPDGSSLEHPVRSRSASGHQTTPASPQESPCHTPTKRQCHSCCASPPMTQQWTRSTPCCRRSRRSRTSSSPNSAECSTPSKILPLKPTLKRPGWSLSVTHGIFTLQRSLGH